MIVLGVHDGHNASAALFIDNRLAIAVAEDRLSRDKHAYGYPEKAIALCLRTAGVAPKDIDRVAMSTATLPPAYYYTRRNATFSIEDYWREQKEYWYPKLYEGKDPKYLDIFAHRVDKSRFPYDERLIKDEKDHKGMFRARVDHLCRTLGVAPERITAYDHHKCHAHYGLLASIDRFDGPVLVYTMDGGGDGINGTVSVARRGQLLDELSRSANCNIGRIYRYATLLLGMRPADHEYKLMGLAAYNSHEFARKAYDIYAETLQVDGLGFRYGKEIKDHFFHFKNALEGERFDAIAYAVQRRTEELLVEWIGNGIAATGVGCVIMSGGVAQNIKANKLIAELPGIERLFIPPGPADESISIGAGYMELVKQGVPLDDIRPIETPYVGQGHSEADIDAALSRTDGDWAVTWADDDTVAALLERGDVVARFAAEPMEFGARALGNRSIVADPRRPETIHHINKLVKMRDFWMPFAPSILEERADDYLVNPKKIEARFMAVGFDTTPLAHKHLTAGLHPFDRTARPQVVRRKDNPGYHALIRAFERRTGVGAVLNTSFNIHGEPIVGTPEDALSTFARSGLHHLILGGRLVSKRGSGPIS